MTRYYWDRDAMDWAEVPPRRAIDPHAPIVMPDTPEYQSPIDGRLITSRSHRREDLRRNNCVEWDPGLKRHDGAQRGYVVNPKYATGHLKYDKDYAKEMTQKREQRALEAGRDVVRDRDYRRIG